MCVCVCVCLVCVASGNMLLAQLHVFVMVCGVTKTDVLVAVLMMLMYVAFFTLV